jgi:hypothetical protein
MRLRWRAVTVGLMVAGCGDVASLGSGSTTTDGSTEAGHRDASLHDGGARDARVDAGSLDAGISGRTYVDAGYYYGDGSYFVDSGAYPDVATPGDSATPREAGAPVDARAGDAATGCGALSACCGSLTSGSKSLCESVVAQGSAANCSTELVELQGAGDCTGVSILATDVQVPPTLLVSDGTSLFWTTAGIPGLLGMRVGTGAVKVLVSEAIHEGPGNDEPFLAVDYVNVYVWEDVGVVRIPKNGAPATLVNEPVPDPSVVGGPVIEGVTMLGDTAYWAEQALVDPGMPSDGPVPQGIGSTPLGGGSISLMRFSSMSWRGDGFAVTASAAFALNGPVLAFSTLSVSAAVPGDQVCTYVTSDTDAVYCAQATGSNLRIAIDRTVTPLGPAVNTMPIVFDDTYAYWVDDTTVGTIMKAPKAGGGTAIVLARDANPTAIAVDATTVYWGDQAGYIKSLPK